MRAEVKDEAVTYTCPHSWDLCLIVILLESALIKPFPLSLVKRTHFPACFHGVKK